MMLAWYNIWVTHFGTAEGVREFVNGSNRQQHTQLAFQCYMGSALRIPGIVFKVFAVRGELDGTTSLIASPGRGFFWCSSLRGL